MRRVTRRAAKSLLIATAVTAAFAMTDAQALVFGVQERRCDNGETYMDYYGGTYTGDPNNAFAPFRVVIPAKKKVNGKMKVTWNGKLLAYARGTGTAMKVNASGQPLDVNGNPLTNPPTVPPLLGLTPLNNALPGITANGLTYPPNPDAFEEDLVCSRKYAAVVTDYKPDFDFLQNGKLGWVVEDGTRDIGRAILQARRLLIMTQWSWPQKTILLGRSQGSLVALRYAEEHSPLVDGVIAACTVGAGASRSWDSAVDFALAIDVAFGNEHGFGGWPWGNEVGNVADVRDDVVFNRDVAPVLEGWFPLDDHGLPTPAFRANFGRLEFVRLVTGLPLAGFYPFPPAANVPGYAGFNWLGSALLFATEVKADVEGRAGGAVGQNLDHAYGLSPADRLYLAQLGVPSEAIDGWLGAMNVRRNYEASPQGKAYTASYHDFSFAGRQPPHPMLAVHTTTDGLVLPSQETELRETLDATGQLAKRAQLRQTFVEANGHCALTQAEWTVAIEAMEKRLTTGVWPGNDFFPNNGNDLRFNNAFDAGQYPQPRLP
ncbi:hypothetical protein [Accumulibacter sp.]|uniref:hypothetical protein n=1 Tax=Accumulibacter sp. TaxID=2053492 RepID=UPI0025E8747C|nr:hypothetical protein [Accumulibacter sp.]MCP5227942.1 hypothetical protein [Accumulibacter sp.]